MLHYNVFLFSPIGENTYVLHDDDGRCAIIDPGCYAQAERDCLADHISQQRLRPEILLNTHCHLDHVFGNRFVAQTWGLTPHIHLLERPVLEFAPVSGLIWNMPFDAYQGPLAFLDPGKPVSVGGERLEVFFLPGHSPGSVGFYHAGQGFIFSGDVLFREGVGRTDLPGGDFSTLARSIQETLYQLPEETLVLSGHGAETTIGWEKRHNPYVSGVS
ncbi:MAG: MBL fold metallo-hydrolase [Bacteroidetes bacterium]|nr:MBL fold metallo-hydrolase [Bacteroidota bacterium]